MLKHTEFCARRELGGATQTYVRRKSEQSVQATINYAHFSPRILTNPALSAFLHSSPTLDCSGAFLIRGFVCCVAALCSVAAAAQRHRVDGLWGMLKPKGFSVQHPRTARSESLPVAQFSDWRHTW